jgi:hypothetical protein
MSTHASHEDSLGINLLPIMADKQEWIPDLLPRPDGIRFARGILLGVALCLPVWVLVCWAVAVH